MPTLTRTAPSGAKANKKENSASQTRAASQSSTLSDNRPENLGPNESSGGHERGASSSKNGPITGPDADNSPVQKAATRKKCK